MHNPLSHHNNREEREKRLVSNNIKKKKHLCELFSVKIQSPQKTHNSKQNTSQHNVRVIKFLRTIRQKDLRAKKK